MARSCTIGSVNLILAVVLLTEGRLLELSSDVIGGAVVEVPVGVDAVGSIRRRSNLVIILSVVLVFIVAVPVVPGGVAWFATDLTAWGVRASSAKAATAVTPIATSATATGSTIVAGPGTTSPALATATVAGATATTTGSKVGGGLEATAAGVLEVHHALVEVAEHGEDLVEGGGTDAGVEGRGEGLVLLVQPVKDVRDQLVVLDGFARRR